MPQPLAERLPNGPQRRTCLPALASSYNRLSCLAVAPTTDALASSLLAGFRPLLQRSQSETPESQQEYPQMPVSSPGTLRDLEPLDILHCSESVAASVRLDSLAPQRE